MGIGIIIPLLMIITLAHSGFIYTINTVCSGICPSISVLTFISTICISRFLSRCWKILHQVQPWRRSTRRWSGSRSTVSKIGRMWKTRVGRQNNSRGRTLPLLVYTKGNEYRMQGSTSSRLFDNMLFWIGIYLSGKDWILFDLFSRYDIFSSTTLLYCRSLVLYWGV